MKEYKDYAKITAHFDLAIEEAIKFGGDVGKHAVLLFETMRKELDTVPAADVVEVRHGRWDECDWVEYDSHGECVHYSHGGCVCTNCRNAFKKEFVHNPRVNYCPHCGCKMDKEEHNEL